MAAPLRSVVGQGAWYAFGNALSKVAGLVLLPLYTNTRYLTREDFGLWGTFEVTVQLAIGIVGLQLAYALIRYYAEPGTSVRITSTAWWTTVLLAGGTAIPLLVVVQLLVVAEVRSTYGFLVLYAAFEILLAIPLAILRVRDKAGAYTGLIVFKLLTVVGLNLWFVRGLGLELPGLTASYALASAITLASALVLAAPAGIFRFAFDRATARRMLRFSIPLVLAGIGSMALNASDRYVLLAFRPKEEVGLYTLAAKFGGVVNMLAAQPLQLALLPILFRLQESERESFLNATSKYLVFFFGLLTVGLSVFSGPVLEIFKSDAFYNGAIPLVPWIALGFASFGLGIVLDGVLTLYERTGAISFWIGAAAALNVGLNVLVIPWLGALGAALSTFASYFVLLVGKYYTGNRLMKLHIPVAPFIGISLSSIVVSVASVYVAIPGGIFGLGIRILIVVGWLVLVTVTRWVDPADLKNLVRALVPGRQS